MSKSYDLSTSSKWANLSDGEHVVKLRAKGAGYGTSSFSNSVTVTKGATGETWLLNETLDIYRVNGSKRGYYTADFISNGEKFAQIQTEDDNDDQGQYLEYYKVANSGLPTLIYHSYQHNDGGYEWENQAYRTLTFSTPPTGDLLTWLQANGTKQGGVTEHTLTFSGVTVTVDGASVTSPYTLAKDCTIVAETPAPGKPTPSTPSPMITVNNQQITE